MKKLCFKIWCNFFHGASLVNYLAKYKDYSEANIFAYQVQDPKNYGVVEISPSVEIILIEETPNNPKSKFAILSLYFYDNSVISMVKDVKPSLRNELEITDLNLMYLNSNKLHVKSFKEAQFG
jgi:glucose-1-phosphate thymidylyltransferase